VFRLCLGFLADAAAAEDLAQDAMIHLLNRLDRWDAQRPYLAWRNTVVLNLCRDQARKQSARKRVEDQWKLLPRLLQLPNPHAAASHRELRDAITSALAQLPPRE
jgi:RNA polymerase sigma factor (sigma-70 family)